MYEFQCFDADFGSVRFLNNYEKNMPLVSIENKRQDPALNIY